jgi:MEDS: MEthanogen/methylotroph, DcmR Sensory domain
MSPWERLLQKPQRRGHFVQLYDADGSSLTGNVGQYLWEGLRRGDGVLVVATSEHWDLFRHRIEQLGCDTQACARQGHFLFLDAHQTLFGFMRKGQPDWERFERMMRAAMRLLKPSQTGAALRAYGEMVAILWKARQYDAAIRLEYYWNRLLTQSSFSLYCSYGIDLFGKEFHSDAVDALLSTHTHLVPVDHEGKLESALQDALNEVLGPEAEDLRKRMRAGRRPSWAVMPDAESMILWVRKNLPGRAEEIIGRARVLYQEGRCRQATGTPPRLSASLPA